MVEEAQGRGGAVVRPDWNQIRREYVTTGASQRDLSKKYNVSKSLIAKRAKEENWLEKRGQYVGRIDAKVEQQTEKIFVDQTARLYEATNKLLDKVFQLLDLEEALAPRDLKSLSSTLTDIKLLRAKDDTEIAVAENTISVRFINNDWDGGDDA